MKTVWTTILFLILSIAYSSSVHADSHCSSGVFQDCPRGNYNHPGYLPSFIKISGKFIPGTQASLTTHRLPPEARHFALFIGTQAGMTQLPSVGIELGMQDPRLLAFSPEADFTVPAGLAGAKIYLQGVYFLPSVQRWSTTHLFSATVAFAGAYQEHGPLDELIPIIVRRGLDKNQLAGPFFGTPDEESETFSVATFFNPEDRIREVSGIPQLKVVQQNNPQIEVPSQVRAVKKDSDGNILSAVVRAQTAMGPFLEGNWLALKKEPNPEEDSNAYLARLSSNNGLQTLELDNGILHIIAREGEHSIVSSITHLPSDKTFLGDSDQLSLKIDQVLDSARVTSISLLENGKISATAKLRLIGQPRSDQNDHRLRREEEIYYDAYLTIQKGSSKLDLDITLHAGESALTIATPDTKGLFLSLESAELFSGQDHAVQTTTPTFNGILNFDPTTIARRDLEKIELVHSRTSPSQYIPRGYYRDTDPDFHPWIDSYIADSGYSNARHEYTIQGVGLFKDGTNLFDDAPGQDIGDEHTFPASAYLSFETQAPNPSHLGVQVRGARTEFPFAIGLSAQRLEVNFSPQMLRPNNPIGLAPARREISRVTLDFNQSGENQLLRSLTNEYKLQGRLEVGQYNRVKHADRYVNEEQLAQFYHRLGISYPGVSFNSRERSAFEDWLDTRHEWRKFEDQEEQMYLSNGYGLDTAINRSLDRVAKYLPAIPRQRGFVIPETDEHDIPDYIDDPVRLTNNFRAGFVGQNASTALLSGDPLLLDYIRVFQQALTARSHIFEENLISYSFDHQRLNLLSSIIRLERLFPNQELHQLLLERVRSIVHVQYPGDGCLGWLSELGADPQTPEGFFGAFIDGPEARTLTIAALGSMLSEAYKWSKTYGHLTLADEIKERATRLEGFLTALVPHDAKYGSSDHEYYNVSYWPSRQCEANPFSEQNQFRLMHYDADTSWVDYATRAYHQSIITAREERHEPFGDYLFELTKGAEVTLAKKNLREIRAIAFFYLNSLGLL